MDGKDKMRRSIVGGVDTHKDLHVAAVVDHCDRVLDTRSYATTRQGYRLMLASVDAWISKYAEFGLCWAGLFGCSRRGLATNGFRASTGKHSVQNGDADRNLCLLSKE